MKKIFVILALMLNIFFISSCAGGGKQLDAPTDVKVSESGYITWSAVTNAQYYNVIIGDASYRVTVTNYQVKDLREDFTAHVIACATGYLTSNPSESVTFTGTSKAEKKEISDKLLSEFTNPSKVTTDLAVSAAAKLYAKDITKLDIESFDQMTELITGEALSFQTIINYLSAYTKTDLINYVYYIEQKMILASYELSLKEENEELIKVYSNVCAGLQKGDYSFASGFGAVLSNVMNTTVDLINAGIRDLSKLLVSADFSTQGEKLYNLKNAIVKALQKNMILSKDIANVVRVFTDLKDDVIPFLREYVPEGVISEELYANIEKLLGMIDFDEASVDQKCKTLLNSYSTFLNSILEISKEACEKFCSYKVLKLAIGNTLYDKLQGQIATMDTVLTTGQVDAMIEAIAQVFGTTRLNLIKKIGITESEYKTLVRNICTIANVISPTTKEILEDRDLMLSLLDIQFSYDNGFTYNDHITKADFANNLNIKEEDVEEKTYLSYRTYKEDNAYTVNVIEYRVTMSEIENYVYVLTTVSTYKFNNSETLLLFANKILKAYQGHGEVICEAYHNMLSVIIKIAEKNRIENLVIYDAVLDVLKNLEKLSTANLETMFDSSVDLALKLLAYQDEKKIDMDEVIGLIVTNNYDALKEFYHDFGTTENLSQLEEIIDGYYVACVEASVYTVEQSKVEKAKTMDAIHSFFDVK